MAKAEVRCPNCGTSFVIGNGGSPVAELSKGTHYLVPETIRNENVKAAKDDSRMKAFAEAGIDVSKLQTLMQSNSEVKAIFDSNDPIIEQLSKGGFIKNPELFRRWICAQTFSLIKHKNGWTYAVRKRYNTRYVYRQTLNELKLQIKLQNKGVRMDKRYTFFTFEDMKRIFVDLADYNHALRSDSKSYYKTKLNTAKDLNQLLSAVQSTYWSVSSDYLPSAWLNCFKGAGAYYTLQNIIRTHGMVLPNCKNMSESLDKVENLYKEICSYPYNERRWDILLSVLTVAVKETHFELKW